MNHPDEKNPRKPPPALPRLRSSGLCTQVKLAIDNKPGTEKGPDPEEAAYKNLEHAKAGDLFRIRFIRNGEGTATVVSAEAYKMVPGEDQSGVYVFQRTTSMTLQGADRPAVVLSKFLEETTLAVMDKDLLAGTDNLKAGDTVKVKIAGKVLNSIEPYKAAAAGTEPATP